MVKIVEFFNQPIDDNTLPFNVIEDVSVYMKNNPMFYRKHFYPTMLRFKDLMQAKKKINPVGLFNPMIKKATYDYCKEYNIGKRPEELLSNEERKELIQKIYNEELKNIREGVYE
jgi:hypothetical protein